MFILEELKDSISNSKDLITSGDSNNEQLEVTDYLN
jgi:hypothetical protein